MNDRSSPLAWQALVRELLKQSHTVFREKGEIILVETVEGSDQTIGLISDARHLTLTYVPERNAIKWETVREYGFERLSELTTTKLALTLMRRVSL